MEDRQNKRAFQPRAAAGQPMMPAGGRVPARQREGAGARRWGKKGGGMTWMGTLSTVKKPGDFGIGF